MFYKYIIKSILLILIADCAYGAQPKECYSCEGINCLRTSKVASKATCIDPLDSCITVFEESTVIARGCYSALAEQHRNKCTHASDPECHKCYKSLCNDKSSIYCLQCNSKDNSNCYNSVSKIEATRCPISISSNSYCYTRKLSDQIERGCLLDTNEQLKCLDDSACEMCVPYGENTCNRESVDDMKSGSERATIYTALLLTTIVSIV